MTFNRNCSIENITEYKSRLSEYLDKDCGDESGLSLAFSRLSGLMPAEGSICKSETVGSVIIMVLDWAYDFCDEYIDGRVYSERALSHQLQEFCYAIVEELKCNRDVDCHIDCRILVDWYDKDGYSCNFYLDNEGTDLNLSFILNFGSVVNTLSGLFLLLWVILSYDSFIHDVLGLSFSQGSRENLKELFAKIVSDISNGELRYTKELLSSLK